MAETAYIVLRQSGTDAWKHVNTVDAASAPAAIRKAFNASSADIGESVGENTTDRTREGTYVAVPARSWKPVTVQTVQTTTIKLGEAT